MIGLHMGVVSSTLYFLVTQSEHYYQACQSLHMADFQVG